MINSPVCEKNSEKSGGKNFLRRRRNAEKKSGALGLTKGKNLNILKKV